MGVSIRLAMPFDLNYIAHRLRASDRDEIFARMPADPDLLAETAGRSERAWTGLIDGAPVAALGLQEMWPGVWQVWMFGTDDFRQVGGRLVHRAMREGWSVLRQHGAHRLECKSSAAHTEAHEFIERMGGRHEATLCRYGSSGEDFRVYSWLAPFRE